MRVIKHVVMTILLIAGLSIAAEAQKQPPKHPERPPKKDSPTIDPGKEKPPRRSPKEDDKSIKPEMSWVLVIKSEGGYMA